MSELVTSTLHDALQISAVLQDGADDGERCLPHRLEKVRAPWSTLSHAGEVGEVQLWGSFAHYKGLR